MTTTRLHDTTLASAVSSLSEIFGNWAWGTILVELVGIGLLSAGAYLLLRAFNRFVTRVYRGRGRWRGTVLRAAPLVRFAIFAVLAVSIGSLIFEGSTPVLLVTTLALVIALGLGSVDLVRNVLSGAIVGLQRPFTVNDRIRVGDLEGDILRIGIRSTSLRASDGSIVHVPNRRFVSDVVVNTSLEEIGTPTRLEIALPPDVEIPRVKDLARRAAVLSKYASPHRTPRVRVVQREGRDDDGPALGLELQLYAFDARYEDELCGEVLELVGEGLHTSRLVAGEGDVAVPSTRT